MMAAGGSAGEFTKALEDAVAQRSVTTQNSSSILKDEFTKLQLEARKSIQKTLQVQGFYKLTIDGLYGSGTASALKNYNAKYFDKKNLLNRGKVQQLFEIVLQQEQKIAVSTEINTTVNSRYLSAIKLSDDLDKYGTKMASAVGVLIRNGTCSYKEISDYGGWVKSGQRKGQYFMDCGGTRHWFNPNNTTKTLSTAQYVSESSARDACWDYIRAKYSGAKFQAFNNSFTKHLVGSVTYRAGFKLQNAFGNTIKYYADCLIQSDRTMSVNVLMQ